MENKENKPSENAKQEQPEEKYLEEEKKPEKEFFSEKTEKEEDDFWAEEIEKRKQEFQEKTLESPKVAPEVKDYMINSLKKDADDETIDFAKRWFIRKKDEGDERLEGISRETSYKLPDKQMASIAIERGALDDLRKSEDCKEDMEKIKKLDVLKMSFEKSDSIPIEDQVLALNYLWEKSEKIKYRYEVKPLIFAEEDELKAQTETDKLKQEYKKIMLDIGVKLAEGISGRNLLEEAEKEKGFKKEASAEFIRRGLEGAKEKIINNKWEMLSIKIEKQFPNELEIIDNIKKAWKKSTGLQLNNETMLAALDSGSTTVEDFKNIKTKGLFSRNIELRGLGGKPLKIDAFKKEIERVKKEFDKNNEKAATEKLNKEWYGKNLSLNAYVASEVEKLVEFDEEIVEKSYEQAKNRLIEKYKEKKEKIEPKKEQKETKEAKEEKKKDKKEKEEIPEAGKKEKKNLDGLFKILTSKPEDLKKEFVSGNYLYNAIESFTGIKFSDKDKENIKKAVQEPDSLLFIISRFLFGFIAESSEKKERG